MEKKRDALISSRTDTPEKEQAYTKLREHHHNETIAEFVKNTVETHRIIEDDGKLVQKIYPIFKDPDPDHSVDFNAQFYMPAKHFMGYDIDTLYFNTGVIWSMALFLGLLLYFDVLRKIIDGIGNLSNPINRRK